MLKIHKFKYLKIKKLIGLEFEKINLRIQPIIINLVKIFFFGQYLVKI